jgi:hypothetical protein
MYDVNDDMENLFRRAAENYPLKTDGLDWDKVEKGLASSETIVRAKDERRINRSWFLLLLLIPFMWICNNYTNDSIKNSVKSVTANNLPKHAPAKLIESSSTTVNKAMRAQPASDKAISEKNYTNKNQESRTSNNLVYRKQTNTNRNSVEVTEKKISSTGNNFNVNNNDNKDVAKVMSTKPAAKDSNESEATSTLPRTDTSALVNSRDKCINQTQTKEANEVKKAETKNAVTSKKLYVGVVGTLDVSTVKLQSTNKIGKGLGVLIGYQLSKRLSVESGVHSQKKYYFSDAKYFNPKNPYSSASYRLISVTGNCSMWEVPVNLKYNLSSTSKNNWFASVGSSSYFMKAENYDYTYDSYGVIRERNMSYNNSSNYWFSILNLTAGYERPIGRAGSLRVEPYLKLPLKGFGWGRMPITSTGLNIGYTKKLF